MKIYRKMTQNDHFASYVVRQVGYFLGEGDSIQIDRIEDDFHLLVKVKGELPEFVIREAELVELH